MWLLKCVHVYLSECKMLERNEYVVEAWHGDTTQNVHLDVHCTMYTHSKVEHKKKKKTKNREEDGRSKSGKAHRNVSEWVSVCVYITGKCVEQWRYNFLSLFLSLMRVRETRRHSLTRQTVGRFILAIFALKLCLRVRRNEIIWPIPFKISIFTSWVCVYDVLYVYVCV